MEDHLISCPKCGCNVKEKVVTDDNSTLLSRLFGEDGWHKEYKCRACEWTSRTLNTRELNKHTTTQHMHGTT